MSRQKYTHSNDKPKTGKHLTAGERKRIEEMLDGEASPYEIARILGRTTSTITREIRKHVKTIPAKSDCYMYETCRITNLCYYCRSGKCKSCRTHDCRKACKHYEKRTCGRIEKSPYVCNGCQDFYSCTLEKRVYRSGEAQKQYEALWKEKRIGYDLTEEQLSEIERLASPLLKAGHSPYAVIQELGSRLPCSAATLYRLVDDSVLSARNIDLQERVKRKPRKHRRINNKDAYAIITAKKRGHLWSDYLFYLNRAERPAVQLDCVEGTKEDHAVLLTLFWPVEHMQLYFIMDEQDAAHVVAQFDMIEESIGLDLFREMFPAILTDNGHEFTDIDGMERSCTCPGEKRTYIYFCEPNRSDEKGGCERNHRLLRKVIPKGTSLEPFRQRDMLLVTNHVNSYVRKSLGGIRPYDLAMETYPEEFFENLALEMIPSEKLNLTPGLIKKKTA